MLYEVITSVFKKGMYCLIVVWIFKTISNDITAEIAIQIKFRLKVIFFINTNEEYFLR